MTYSRLFRRSRFSTEMSCSRFCKLRLRSGHDAHAVQGGRIAGQDLHRRAANGLRWNRDRHVANHGRATIGPQLNLHIHCVARLRLGFVEPNAFDRRLAAFRQGLHMQRHTLDLGGLIWVREDSLEHVLHVAGNGHAIGNKRISGREKISERDARVAGNLNSAGQRQRGAFAINGVLHRPFRAAMPIRIGVSFGLDIMRKEDACLRPLSLRSFRWESFWRRAQASHDWR